MCSNNDIIRILTLYASVRQCYFQVTTNLNMAQQGKVFRQLYDPNMNTLRICRAVLLSGNVRSEHVAAGESVETTILSEH